MDATTTNALRTFRHMATVVARLPIVAAEAYANGKFGDRPIVEAHFTPGNDQRQGWPPLERSYAMAKASGLSKARGLYRIDTRKKDLSTYQKLSTGTRVKIDRNASFQSSTGTMSGVGKMSNLPMLVRSGLLRESITSRKSRTLHAISVSGDNAFVTFNGLPDYATYLHEGTGRMPKRSPVEPSFGDVMLIEDAVRKYLDGQSGGSGNFAASGNTIGGRARVVA